jgi:hypothetical protein
MHKDLEQVLASGIAESNLAARIAAVLHCHDRLGNHSRPLFGKAEVGQLK